MTDRSPYSEAFFTAAYQMVPDPLVISEEETGRILDVNDTFIGWSGYDRGEIVDRTSLGLGLFVAPEDRRISCPYWPIGGWWTTCPCAFASRMETFGRCSFPPRFIDIAGQRRLLVRGHDVTDRRSGEANLRTLFDSIDEMVFVLNPSGIIQAANKSACERLGYTATELIGQSILIVHPEEQRAEAVRWLEPSSDPRSARIHTLPLITRQGRRLTVETSIVPGCWNDHEALFATVKDRSALVESEEKFSRAFHGNPLPMAISAMHTGVFIDVNDAYLQALGFRRNEVISRSAIDLGIYLHKSQRDAFVDLLAREGRIRNQVLDFRARNGSIRQFVVSSEILSLQGEPYVLSVMEDVTDRKAAEGERQRLFDQIRQDAQIKAELLREINHRVKNNLMAIIGLIVTEKRRAQTQGQGGSPVIPVMDRLMSRIEGMLQVHQMLTDSQWGPVPLDTLARQVITAVVASSSTDDHVSLEIDPSSLEASPRQAGNLALVFNELATNTLKHALPVAGKVVIRVSLLDLGEDIGLVYGDNGPGYPAAVLAGASYGIGMDLLRRLVTETLRGQLSLVNDPGATARIVIKGEEKWRT
jgi:PAS domain S-box-containing protein